MSKKILLTDKAPAPIGPYSQAVDLGNIVFCSGQLGADPATGALGATVAEQTKLSMQAVGAILEAAGLTYANVVKTTIFVADMGDFATVNEVYGSFFTSDPPARSCVQAAALPKGALVEIEVVAAR